VFDLVLAILAAAILFVPIVVVALIVRLTSRGPVLYWSDRVGMLNRIFRMPKFRTMRVNTPAVATHLLLCELRPASTNCRLDLQAGPKSTVGMTSQSLTKFGLTSSIYRGTRC